MPRLNPVVLFALGTAAGALSWFAFAPLLRSASATAAPAPVGPGTLTAAHAASTAGDTPANASSAGIPAVTTAPEPTVPGLHLWEVLARRGAPKDNEARWFTLPDMTGKGGYEATPPDAPINPAFAAFFNLTREESDRAQALLQSTLRLQHEMDVSRIERIESRFRIKTAIAIPDYSAESALLRQTFDGGLRAILGEDRHRVYREWATTAFRDDFPGLAGVRREYHIIPARADDPPGSFQIVQVKRAPGEEQKKGSFTSYHPTLEDALKSTQLPLARYLPSPVAATTPAAPATP